MIHYFQSRLIEDLSASSDSIKALLNQGGSTFEDNFAKLSIYYEELNLEEIVESPAYPVSYHATCLFLSSHNKL